MSLEPGGLLAWLIVGAIAGWLAGQLMSGRGFGLLGDIIVGIVGALLGGFLFSRFMEGQTVNLLGSIAVALVGSILVIIIVRVVIPGRGSAF